MINGVPVIDAVVHAFDWNPYSTALLPAISGAATRRSNARGRALDSQPCAR
jgi:hypothetical protein